MTHTSKINEELQVLNFLKVFLVANLVLFWMTIRFNFLEWTIGEKAWTLKVSNKFKTWNERDFAILAWLWQHQHFTHEIIEMSVLRPPTISINMWMLIPARAPPARCHFPRVCCFYIFATTSFIRCIFFLMNLARKLEIHFHTLFHTLSVLSVLQCDSCWALMASNIENAALVCVLDIHRLLWCMHDERIAGLQNVKKSGKPY